MRSLRTCRNLNVKTFYFAFFLICWTTSISISAFGKAGLDKVVDAARQKVTGQIAFDTMTWDFGQIKRGEKVSYDFKFVNKGQGTLVLQGVHASCGCTAVELEKGKQYEPGERGSIKVTLDSSDFLGRLAKGITVMTNEKHLPDRTLTMNGVVVSEFEVDPPLVDFGEVYARQGAAQMVTIRPTSFSSFNIEKVRYNQDYLDVGYAKDGSRWVVTVKLKENAQTGFFKETIYVANNSKSLPELPIPVRGTVRGNLEFAPRYLEFGQIAPDDKSNRSVTLKALEEFKIVSSRAEVNINGSKVVSAEKLVEVNMLTHEKGKQLISVNLVNKAGQAGAVHGKVFLETTDPQQKQLTIDFYAFFR